MNIRKGLGMHIIVDAYGCNFSILNNAQLLEKIFLEAAKKAEVTILNSNFHKFSPQGVSGVVIIAESHLSIHTWPEYGYAAIDIYTCGSKKKAEVAVKEVLNKLKPLHFSIMKHERGFINKNFFNKLKNESKV